MTNNIESADKDDMKENTYPGFSNILTCLNLVRGIMPHLALSVTSQVTSAGRGDMFR
jgi:hypothetical protein